MRFSSVLLAASAFVVAFAQPKFTNSEFGTLNAGEPFVLTWSDAQGPVTITLKRGPTGNLQTVMTVVSGATGTSFSWIPSASLADGTYALEIDDSSNVPNFSARFQLAGGSGSVTGGSSAIASATASGASSAAESSAASSAASSEASSAASSAPASSLPPLTTTTTTTTRSTSSVHSTSTSSLTSSARPSVHNTTTSSTVSSTGSSASPSSSSSAAPSPPDNNSAAGLASPLAFVFLAFAALLTLN